ncbi:Cdc6/Cdc18 family protein [Halococcus agarilyticus]|uniref:Cdc6/Cdc18 family protein n=1 Tax=Halococcus agarilyticus TaxID=1232219 RepID=UPI00067804DB
MSNYDDLFDDTAPDDSVFTNKGALNPLSDPDEIVAREHQERELATLLNGVHEGYLPTTASIYGPPGTGKTLTTRRVCAAFATRNDAVAVEYVNLKECRSLFSVANEIHFELIGEKKGAYEGLDGVFEGIWEALAEYPEWTVLLLDEIDHIRQDSNYDPNEFFYRLLRGEGKLKRGIHLSAWLLSNKLLEVDLRLDSRVESAMSGEKVFFPPYDPPTLKRILDPQLEQAFREDALSSEVAAHGIRSAANRWGDARKALTLFRQAGETANDSGRQRITADDIDTNLAAAERSTMTEKLLALPLQHMLVLSMVTGGTDRRTGEVVQPVSIGDIQRRYENQPEQIQVGSRAIRKTVTDLETMGLLETWIDSRGRDGRVKQVQTTFDPEWVNDAVGDYVERNREHLPDIEPDRKEQR